MYEIQENYTQQQTNLIQYQEVIVPITPPPIDIPAIISNDEYSGPYDFEVSIDPNYCNKNPWVVSYFNMIIYLCDLDLLFRIGNATSRFIYVVLFFYS